MGTLTGKVAAITGGASGIGEAAVRRFVAEGGKVAFADLDGERGRRVAADIEGNGGAVTFTEAQANLLWIVVWLGFGLLVFSDHILGVRDPARRHGRSTRAICASVRTGGTTIQQRRERRRRVMRWAARLALCVPGQTSSPARPCGAPRAPRICPARAHPCA